MIEFMYLISYKIQMFLQGKVLIQFGFIHL